MSDNRYILENQTGIDLDKIKDVLWEVIAEFTGKPDNLMFADQKISIPEEGIYGTIKLLTTPTMEGFDSEEMTADNKIKISGQRNMTCSLNFYREGSLQLMANLQSLIQTSMMRYKIQSVAASKGVKFSIIDALSVQNLTSLVQSNYEERAQMDLRIRAVSEITVDMGTIENVEIESEISRAKEDPSPIQVNLDVQS